MKNLTLMSVSDKTKPNTIVNTGGNNRTKLKRFKIKDNKLNNTGFGRKSKPFVIKI